MKEVKEAKEAKESRGEGELVKPLVLRYDDMTL